MGVDALGDDRRPQVVGDRQLPEPGGLAVRGDPGADRRRGPPGVAASERLGHAAVQAAALRRARLAVRDVPQLVVGEVVGVRPLLADDALPPELVERAHHGVFVAHQAHQHVEVERAPDHGGGRRHLAGAVGQLRETPGDHRVRPRRQPGDPLLGRAGSAAAALRRARSRR